ncbi:MAG: hypothetical protein QM708_09525 [Propioniciclava sp.]|uniref:hypothetical protein n=1 Tax=Propioniciclava sp. TaxID=2038686 RepID=UPI0039E46233
MAETIVLVLVATAIAYAIYLVRFAIGPHSNPIGTDEITWVLWTLALVASFGRLSRRIQSSQA